MSEEFLATRHRIASAIVQTLGVQLAPMQQQVFDCQARVVILAGGEGSGKTFLGALRALTWPHAERLMEYAEAGDGERLPPKLVWIVGADFEDARKSAEYIQDWLEQLELLDRSRSSIPVHRDQKCILVSRDNIIYETISGYDPLKIGREQPDAIIGEEVSRWDVGGELFRRCIGRLQRKYPRAWGFFSGSFEGSVGWFPDTWRYGQVANEHGWVSFSLPSWANEAIYPGGEDNPAIKELKTMMTERRFLERHAGVPVAPSDLVFPEFSVHAHVSSDIRLLPDRPVHLFVDPGDFVYAVLFVQFVGNEVWVLDEVYASRWPHDRVLAECSQRPGWDQVADVVMDVAGRQHHFGFASPVEAWRDATGLPIYTRYVKVEDAIERIRSVLMTSPTTGRPYLRIRPECRGLLAEFGAGMSPVEGVAAWRYRHGKPEARNDHAIKALAYGLIYHLGVSRPDRKRRSTRFASYLAEAV